MEEEKAAEEKVEKSEKVKLRPKIRKISAIEDRSSTFKPGKAPMDYDVSSPIVTSEQKRHTVMTWDNDYEVDYLFILL